MADSYFLDTDFTPTLLEDENGNTLIQLGENTAEAAVQAAIATSKAAEASASADTAETAAQAALGAANYYTTIAAGVAATAVDDLFTSDETGSLLFYRKTGSSPFYLAFDIGFLTKVSSQWKADGYNIFKNSHFGYGAGYRTLVLGNGSNQTVALNYDPINITDGGNFNGDGREVVVRNGTNFITPNSGATAWLNPMSFLDGNVGIGTASPTAKLDVRGSAYVIGVSGVRVTDTADGNGFEISPASTINALCYNRTTNAYLPVRWRAGVQSWEVDNVERMRIDGSGNVGIGATSPAYKLDVKLHPQSVSQFGEVRFGADSNTYAMRLGSGTDGTGIPYARITAPTDGNAFMEFYCSNALRMKIDANGHIIPGTDGTQNLGSGSLRFSTVYAGTGTINTSDQRHKVWQEPTEDRTAKDRRIARRILDELGWYQFTDAVDAKGPDGARWHFGARAQRVWHIVADEGLAPPLIDLDGELLPDLAWQGPVAPAWLCFDTWNETFVPEMADVTVTEEVSQQVPTDELDDDGNPIIETIIELVERTESQPTGNQIKTRDAGYLFGFRTDQINMLLNWSLHDRLAALEASQ